MEAPELAISASTFAEFVIARSTDRLQMVRSAIETYGTDYDPRTDYYKKIRDALRESVVTRTDEPVLRAAERATPKKRLHYWPVANGWTGWKPRVRAHATAANGTWQHEGLVLKVRPLLTVTLDQELLLVGAYLKGPALNDDAAQALTRVMELSMPDVPTRMAVIDVRRGKLIKARRRRDKDYDVVIQSEAALFNAMFHSMSRAA